METREEGENLFYHCMLLDSRYNGHRGMILVARNEEEAEAEFYVAHSHATGNLEIPETEMLFCQHLSSS